MQLKSLVIFFDDLFVHEHSLVDRLSRFHGGQLSREATDDLLQE